MPPPRPDLGLKYEMLLAAQSAMAAATPDEDDEQWRLHDVLQRTAETMSLPLPQAAMRMGIAMPAASWMIQLAVQLQQWDDGGGLGFEAMADWLEEAAQEDEDLQLLLAICEALIPLARAHGLGRPLPTRDECVDCGEQWWQLSEDLESLGRGDSASECALVAAALLRRARSDSAAAAGRWALQLLYAQPRQAIFCRRPRIKYPQWPAPDFEPTVVRAVAHAALQALFFGEPPAFFDDAALDASLREMGSDADHVIVLPLSGIRVPVGNDWQMLPDLRFEVRFGNSLLLRLQARSMAGGLPACVQARALVGCWLEHGDDLTYWRDGHQYDWWSSDGRRLRDVEGAATSAIACVQAVGHRMLVVLGEVPEDIDRWQLHERYAQAARDNLRLARERSVQR